MHAAQALTFNAMHYNVVITSHDCYVATGLLVDIADVQGTCCLQEACWR